MAGLRQSTMALLARTVPECVFEAQTPGKVCKATSSNRAKKLCQRRRAQLSCPKPQMHEHLTLIHSC